jgi:hypothetical protein
MSKDIATVGPNYDTKILSREELRKELDKRIQQELPHDTFKEKFIDKFNNLPSYLKSLNNFDPTGAASYVADIIADEKAKLDAEKNYEIIYQFYLGMKILELKTKTLDAIIRTKIPLLTEAYINYSRQTIYKDLVISFRNVWCNSILNDQDNLEEQLGLFNLLASLTFDHIKILKELDLSFKAEKREGLKPDTRGVEWVNDIASKLGFKEEYAQVLCLSLAGTGLIRDVSAPNPAMGAAKAFRIGDYFNTFLKYVLTPDVGPEMTTLLKVQKAEGPFS